MAFYVFSVSVGAIIGAGACFLLLWLAAKNQALRTELRAARAENAITSTRAKDAEDKIAVYKEFVSRPSYVNFTEEAIEALLARAAMKMSELVRGKVN